MSIDVRLGADGDLEQFTRHISGSAVTLQRIKLRLETFLGEWILDRTKGMPWLLFIAQKPARVAEIVAFIRREIETTPGVIAVDTIEGVHDVQARTVTITASIRIEDEPDAVVVEVIPPSAGGNASPAVLFIGRQGRILTAAGSTP